MATTHAQRGTAAGGAPLRRRRWKPALLASLVLMVIAGVVAGIVLATTPARPSEEDPVRRAASFIDAQLESSAAPAASYAVVDDGHLAATGAVGEGIAPDTPFLIGSLSKSFTALAIMQLADRGAIGIDDPVTRHIPWFHTASEGAVITVRQLLNQTSGLPTAAGTADMFEPQTTLQQRVRVLGQVELAGTPGETFRYSNKNYAVLGLILEQVSGQDYGAYVREHIFEPLGMHDSYTDKGAARRAGLVPGSGTWFGASIERSTEPYPGALPDGYLISTAADLAHYAQAQLDGAYQGTRIVSERGLELMHTASVPAEYGNRDHYGFGWATGTVRGQRVVSHMGDLPSYFGHLTLLPESGQAVVVLTSRHALLDDRAAPMRGAVEILSGGSTPEISRGFLLSYVLVDALALALLAGLVVGTVRLVRRLRGIRHHVAGAGRARAVLMPGLGSIVLAALTYLAVFVSMGAAMDGGGIMSLETSLAYAPDITALVLALVGFLAVRGVAVLLTGVRTRRRVH